MHLCPFAELTRRSYSNLPPCIFEKLAIDTLLTARLCNTHFNLVGAGLQRLELIAERADYRRPLHGLLALLSECPLLEHLYLSTCISMGNLVEMPENNIPPITTLELSRLQFFALTDDTLTCHTFLPFIHFPTTSDFHLVIIEEFGKTAYNLESFRQSLAQTVLAFNGRVAHMRALPVLTVEVILDQGRDNRAPAGPSREWPEELRLSLSPTVCIAKEHSLFDIARPEKALRREHAWTPNGPNLSLAVRSEMLSSRPKSLEDRQCPTWRTRAGVGYTSDNISYPRLEDIIQVFMHGVQALHGLDEIQTVLLPAHSYIPSTVRGWTALLSYLDMITLILATQSDEEEVNRLWQYLARKEGGLWPQSSLRSVSLPKYIVGKGKVNYAKFNKLMDFDCNYRRGCNDIVWDVPLLDT